MSDVNRGWGRRETLALLGTALLDVPVRAAGLAAVAGEPALLMAAVAPDILRIVRRPAGASPSADDGALDSAKWPELVPTGDSRTVTNGSFTVDLSPDGRTLTIRHGGGEIQRLGFADDGGLTFAIGSGPLLGLGQGGPQFDRRGSVDAMRSGQGGYKLATHGARVPVPWLIGTGQGWALFVHTPVGAFDLSGGEGRFLPRAGGQELDLFVVAARDPARVMRAYAEITGLPAMPPLWSFGYQQSHRTLGPPEEILAEAKRFRAAKLPCDAMIYLGTGFCPNGWNTDNGEFAWNPKVFPDPPAAIAALHGEDFKVVLHVVIEGKRMTGRASDPCTAAPLPSGRTADGHWPPDRQVACYWPFHKPLADLGIDGWWPDQGDGLDAPSRLARNRMYFEGQQLWRPNRRVYALHRNGFAGMQRFAAFLWSGDVESRWETLANHVPIAVNTALSGIPYWGTDIGGFVATDEYSGELYARWFQFAAFNPLFRSHGRDWRLHTPFGWSDGVRGFAETKGWNPDPGSLKDPRIEPICRQYLELRYRLIPYLYSAVHEACASGMPIIRALWLHHGDDPEAVAAGDQYLFGRDLLVAPVVERGATSRSLYLPAGDWYDVWTGERQKGGRRISRAVDLATMPLYARAGAILPLGPVRQHLADGGTAPEALRIHPGADGRFTLYEDDGESFDYREGRYRLTEFRWDNARRRLTVAPAASSAAALPPAARRFAIELPGRGQVATLDYEGAPATVTLTV